MNTSDVQSIQVQLADICKKLNCTVSFGAAPPALSRQNEEFTTSPDSVWQIRSAFMVMTMQSGFALLEAGYVGRKNLANIMVKNTADVAFGGLVFWLFGYGISFGEGNAFIGFTHMAVDACSNVRVIGSHCTQYFFQFSFASTANTILSGAICERIKLLAYIVLSAVNEISYCVPLRWAWSNQAFLADMGFYDLASTCVVHGSGGASALVAAIMVGPRVGRWKSPEDFGMTSPVTALTGTLLLWWAWFSFNCGSTLGSTGHLWKTNALVAVNTLNGSVGGGCFGICSSMLLKKGRVDVTWLINAVLGGLVAITGICSVTSPLESLFVGAIGAGVSIATTPLLEHFKIDDPVGAVPVHFFAGIWGILAVGLFGHDDEFGTLGNNGLFHGGGCYLLGVQTLGMVTICAWSAATTAIFVFCIEKTIGIRMNAEHEQLGADFSEHGISNGDGLRGIVAKDVPNHMDDSEFLKLYAMELRKRSNNDMSHICEPANDNYIPSKEEDMRIYSPLESDSSKTRSHASSASTMSNNKELSGSASNKPLAARPMTSNTYRSRRSSLVLPRKLKIVSTVRVGSASWRKKSGKKAPSTGQMPTRALPNLPEMSQ